MHQCMVKGLAEEEEDLGMRGGSSSGVVLVGGWGRARLRHGGEWKLESVGVAVANFFPLHFSSSFHFLPLSLHHSISPSFLFPFPLTIRKFKGRNRIMVFDRCRTKPTMPNGLRG